MTSRSLLLRSGTLLLAALTLSITSYSAQRRDHLTELEVDQIKEAQVLDKRIEVFVKAVERRMRVITGSTTDTAKQQKKDTELYGDLPTGTRTELVGDIAKILDEAVTNIDDVSAHDEKNPLIPKALRILAKEVTRVVEQLRPLQAQAKDDAELASFEYLIQNAEPILEAANRLPPPLTEKELKERKKAEKEKAKN